MRRVVSGKFELQAPAQQAIKFFTPEGEKEWVPGWNPTYPAGEATQTPGSVFITDVHGVNTIWMVQLIDTNGCAVAYSRVTPGLHAGTVQVSCDDAPDGGCVVTVTYDMTLLPGSDSVALDDYDDGPFEAMLNHWATAVSALL
jgi:hypothetical protein